MLKLIPHFLRMGRLASPYHLERSPGPDDEVTYEEFFKSKIDEEMFEYWAIPMFETMCSYTGEDVSRKAFLALLASYLNADSVTFQSGVGALPEALAGRLQVELGARVTQVSFQKDGTGAKVTYIQDGAVHSLSANIVIVAVPGNQVLPLIDSPAPPWRDFFPRVHYSTGALHYHTCQTDYQPPVKGVFIPRTLKLPINSMGFEQYRDGRWLMLSDPSVYLFNMNESDDALIERAVGVMETIFPALKGCFTAHRIFRWTEKVPTFRPGYLQALSDFWADPQEGPVYFCGDYFAGPSTGGALHTGKECAERVLRSA
jgi:protoporphyrinogen oxidase